MVIIIIMLLFYAVLNVDIFLLGELQSVAKGKEDAFILHV